MDYCPISHKTTSSYFYKETRLQKITNLKKETNRQTDRQENTAEDLGHTRQECVCEGGVNMFEGANPPLTLDTGVKVQHKHFTI